jgi:hypothetical protein
MSRHYIYAFHDPDNLTAPNIRTAPFVDDVRALANNCFDRFAAMHDGRSLDSETRHADLEAFMLILTGFSFAIRDAQRDGNMLLAFHIGVLLNEVQRDGAYQFLHGLAIDGGTA